MADIAKATEYLQSLLNSPLLEADPVYQELKGEGITAMLKTSAMAKGYLLFTQVPETELPLIYLMAKREIFLTLATQVAPEYDVETEFTKLLKSKRFDHYIRLVSEVTTIIKEMTSSGMVGGVVSGNMLISSRDGSRRNYAFANEQEVSLTLVPATTSVDIDWGRFDNKIANFSAYRLLIGHNLYDPYDEQPLKEGNAIASLMFYDINRTKFRVCNLTPDTDYEALIMLVANSGKKDMKCLPFHTLVVTP